MPRLATIRQQNRLTYRIGTLWAATQADDRQHELVRVPLGPDGSVGDLEIVGSIPPDEMARSLAFMLPAMNADDRADLLGGMRAGAPQEAFDAVVGLARSVLQPADFDGLATRLEFA